MKLNRKGYLTIEVILASVVAITIAIFLMDITVKLVNTTNDYYIDTELITDKALITKNIKKMIKDDIENNGIITNISCNNLYCDITFENNNTNKIEILNNNNEEADYIIKYGNYGKRLNKNLHNYSITSSQNDDYYLIKIEADNKFLKSNFEINIIIYKH